MTQPPPPPTADRPSVLRALETLHGTLGLSTLGALLYVWQAWTAMQTQVDAAAADAAASAALLESLTVEVAELREDVRACQE